MIVLTRLLVLPYIQPSTKTMHTLKTVYLIPSDDPHLSEYVPAAYMRRGFLTDFHGSAGTAVVTMTDAYLWTDSRLVGAFFVCGSCVLELLS